MLLPILSNGAKISFQHFKYVFQAIMTENCERKSISIIVLSSCDRILHHFKMFYNQKDNLSRNILLMNSTSTYNNNYRIQNNNI